MKTLVLGGSVFVGRHVVDALTTAGHDVAVLNRGRTPAAFPISVERLVADRTDLNQLRAAIGGRDWDAVFDVSGFVMAAGGSDIDGLLDLLDGQVGHYVYVSSIMAYDQSLVGVFPWTEDLRTNSTGPSTYGGFKAMAEAAMLARSRTHGFPATIVRPAAIYGPDNNIFDMETPMFLRLMHHRPVLVPHGGLVVGSYGHVDDLCGAMLAIVDTIAARGEIFNVTGDSLDVNAYIALLAEVVGHEPNVEFIPDPMLSEAFTPVYGHLFGARHHAMISTEKMRRLVPYTPRYNVRTGHEHTFRWFLDQGLDRVEVPLVDPVWRATWDFEAEAVFAKRLRSG